MAKAQKDILTTADTAKLLGVSVRTVQLLIEGGSIPSWKTPGGHRRVYRADIEALIEGRPPATPPPSATAVVVASADRLPCYELLFAGSGECAGELFTDTQAALLAIGASHPCAVLVDLADADPLRLAFLHSVLADPSLGHSRILAVGDGPAAATAGPGRVIRSDTPEQAVAALRRSLADAGPVPVPAGAAFPIALNEGQRLAALERTGLLDTPPEEAFDRVTWLAAQALGAPISLLTLLTPTRQWFKSRFGLDLPETPRSWAFCNYTILQKRVFAVEDLAADPRFAGNPAVAGEPGFRFYAGAPILDGAGFAVGSLCVIDCRPRVLEEQEAQALLALAGLASAEVRLRATERQLRETLRQVGRQTGRRAERPSPARAGP